MLAQKKLQYDNKSYLLNAYNRHPVNFVKGEGCYLYDDYGNKYLDFLSGIAVTGFGHGNETLTNEAVNQLNKLWHVSNLFNSVEQNELAEKLAVRSGLASAFFCNSGTEANEAAIKFARKWGNGRNTIITTLGGFHGRTMGSLSASAQYKLWDGFHPLTPGFKYVPYNNIEAIKHSIDDNTVAIMVEPIQGENGIIVPDENYLFELRQLCNKHNLLLILDEVQTGMGRTGKLFSYQWHDITPDIITAAKGIANGLPLGAVICSQKVADVIKPGMHGSTFGGNPVAVMVANKVLEMLTYETINNVSNVGQLLVDEIKQLDIDEILDVRGKGLMIGIELDKSVSAKKISESLLEDKVITATAGDNVLRLLPPFIITHEEILIFIDKLQSIFSQLGKTNNSETIK